MAGNNTEYIFADEYKLLDASEAIYLSVGQSVAILGNTQYGYINATSDFVSLIAQSSKVITTTSTSDVFRVQHLGSDFLHLNVSSDMFLISNSTTPFIVRYVNDPSIDIDAANKRYVDNKMPAASFTLVGSSTVSGAGSDRMVIIGTTSDALVPQLIVSSSFAILFSIAALIKGDGSSIGSIASQEYIFGARVASDGALSTNNQSNARSLYNSTGKLKLNKYNLSFVTAGSSLQVYFNYIGSSDIFLSKAFVDVFEY